MERVKKQVDLVPGLLSELEYEKSYRGIERLVQLVIQRILESCEAEGGELYKLCKPSLLSKVLKFLYALLVSPNYLESPERNSLLLSTILLSTFYS